MYLTSPSLLPRIGAFMSFELYFFFRLSRFFLLKNHITYHGKRASTSSYLNRINKIGRELDDNDI